MKKPKIILFLSVIFIVAAVAGWKYYSARKSKKPIYQTTQAEKGTLVISVSASGQVSQANSATVSTKASGVVKKIFVENGQLVKTGDKIAELELDLEGKQRADSSYASYQSAKNSLDTARANIFSAQSTMLSQWKTYMDLAQSGSYQNADGSPRADSRTLPQFMTIQDDWLSSEAKFKVQQETIKQAQTSLNAAWLSYQQTSPVIYAPISGTVTGLSLQINSVLVAQTNTSGTSTAQKIASIQTAASPTIQVDLSQIDAPKIKIGDKAILTFDAFYDKTYTGKIISIDTIGAVSSGVTTYPAVIKLDLDVPELFSNMTATANIITQSKSDILLIPISSVKTQNGRSLVQVMKNGRPEDTIVETGIFSATQIEIISGLNEGEIIVTGTTQTDSNNPISTNNSQERSPFSGFGGGGAVRLSR